LIWLKQVMGAGNILAREKSGGIQDKRARLEKRVGRHCPMGRAAEFPIWIWSGEDT